MKKSVVLVIAVIYFMAIIIVGFLGLRMRIYNEIKYVESIECVSDGYKSYPEDNEYDGYIEVKHKPGETLKVLVKCVYSPNDANSIDKNYPFEYVWDKNASDYTVTIQKDGTCIVEFVDSGTCNLTIRATDEKHVELKIQIKAIDSDKCKYFTC